MSMIETDTKKQIPEGWISSALNEKTYFKLVGSGVGYWKGLKNYISTKSVQGTKIVEIEDEITYNTRPSRANMQPKIGRVAFAKMKDTSKVLLINKEIQDHYILSTGFSLIEPKISCEYLFQVFQSERFNHYKNLYSEGSTQQAVSNDDYRNIYIKFPQSFTEQQKIVDLLTTADKAIEKTDQLIEKYKRIKEGLMLDLFRYGIDDHGQLRSEETHRFKDSPLGRIPEEWEIVSLGKRCAEGGGSIQTGPFGSQLHAKDYKEEGVPIITVEHLSERKILHQNLPLVGEADYKRLNKYVLQFGDLVFSRVGAIDRCSFTSKKEEGWLFSGRCLRVRPGKLFDSTFLSYLLNYVSSRQWILNNSVGSTMHCLNTTILFNLPVICPPTTEQSRIASALASTDATIEEEDNYRQKLLALKRGLMEDLLSGTVRVNHLIKE